MAVRYHVLMDGKRRIKHRRGWGRRNARLWCNFECLGTILAMVHIVRRRKLGKNVFPANFAAPMTINAR